MAGDEKNNPAHWLLSSLFCDIRGNEWTRSEGQLEGRRRFVHNYPKLGRALGLRDCLRDVFSTGETDSLKWWCGWAARSRLLPFRKLAKTINAQWNGILAFMETRLTNAAINGILQLAKRMARGFHNFHYFRFAADLKIGLLQLDIPQI